ncbi:hypothetical protein FHS21_005310, partial [Phyllobacterium trifolii]|nr:hypothetical protein [Phyllobacterium trifolii]
MNEKGAAPKRHPSPHQNAWNLLAPALDQLIVVDGLGLFLFVLDLQLGCQMA